MADAAIIRNNGAEQVSMSAGYPFGLRRSSLTLRVDAHLYGLALYFSARFVQLEQRQIWRPYVASSSDDDVLRVGLITQANRIDAYKPAFVCVTRVARELLCK
jgi:hypothetical protein